MANVDPAGIDDFLDDSSITDKFESMSREELLHTVRQLDHNMKIVLKAFTIIDHDLLHATLAGELPEATEDQFTAPSTHIAYAQAILEPQESQQMIDEVYTQLLEHLSDEIKNDQLPNTLKEAFERIGN